MFVKADIRRIIIAVPKSEYSEVITNIGKNVIVHIDNLLPDEKERLNSYHSGNVITVDRTFAEKIISTANNFFSELSLSPDYSSIYDSVLENSSVILKRDFEKDFREASSINKKIIQYKKLRDILNREIEALRKKINELDEMQISGIELNRLREMKYLSYIYGKVGPGFSTDSFNDSVFYMLNGSNLLVLFTPDLEAFISETMKNSSFENLDYLVKYGNTPEIERDDAEKRINDLEKRLSRIEFCYISNISFHEKRMIFLSAVYSFLIKISGIETKLIFSKEIVIINGWIDIRDNEKIDRTLYEICGEKYYCKIGSISEKRRFRDRIPVLMKNSTLFRPFELLVRMMGTPGNSELDPTPAAAMAYIIIFGTMFGDAGQGPVLAVTGYFIKKYGHKKYGVVNDTSDFGTIMTWCGFSAAVFGFLYGSFFSNEHIIPALLFHPMERMMDLLLMTIIMGAFIISSGILINIVNSINSGDYGRSIFDTKGAAGLAVYFSFIFFSIRFFLTGQVPVLNEITASLVIPVTVFCLRGPFERLLFHGDDFFPNGIFEYFVETLIEIIEMFSGFLGNTISYMRAGAFALSHAGLSIAVYTLAGIIDPSMKSITSIAVIITGNLFIIILEGLVCGIQSMRLEYYEFFSRFFKGNGVPFIPFSLYVRQEK